MVEFYVRHYPTHRAINPDKRQIIASDHKYIAKKILYFDMDGALVDYPSGIAQLSQETQKEYEGRLYAVPGVFFTH